MKLNKSALFELGKFFYNLALAVVVSVIIQPLVLGKANIKLIVYGIITAVVLLFLGFYLITVSDRFNKYE